MCSVQAVAEHLRVIAEGVPALAESAPVFAEGGPAYTDTPGPGEAHGPRIAPGCGCPSGKLPRHLFAVGYIEPCRPRHERIAIGQLRRELATIWRP